MAVSDKARFYLEQTVAELREWERREIFTKDEIRSITSKRSDFEHAINAPGPKAADYARYVEYEMNLDSLRAKRVKRKGLKRTTHTGQRRIFFILDRACRKFPGDVGLWMQYIEYAKTQRANKRLAKVFTDALRMHPTKAELWIYAARYAMDTQADVGAARSYMQRGLRFCSSSQRMYLEYCRLEMGYLAKIAARRKVLGLDSISKASPSKNEQHDMDSDVIALPSLTATETADYAAATNGATDGATDGGSDEATAEIFDSTPVMTGAIPMAIFDAAMKQFPGDDTLGLSFFEVFAEFSLVPCTTKILQRVIDHLLVPPHSSIAGHSCRCRLHIVGVSGNDVAFPTAIRKTLAEIKLAMGEVGSRAPMLATMILTWISPMVQDKELGPELRRILAATEAQLLKTSEGG